MATQFTAIMAREAIIGPTINSQAGSLESNIGEKGYCGELEREIKGIGLYLSASVFPPSFSCPPPLFSHFTLPPPPSPPQPLSLS